jgi:uncharacterized protein with GYD domain
MPKFLFEARYSPEGIRGVTDQGGSRRRMAIQRLFEAHDGTLEGFYFAFGDADVYAFGDLPDNETATAIALAINRDGRTMVKTVVLLTPEEVDAAARISVEYFAPGA